MGDTLWGTPAIRAIKKNIPHSCIDLLLQPQWKSLFKENKNITRLISYHPQWYLQLLKLPNILKFYYDHVFIFHANKDIRRILPWLRTSFIWSHQYPDIIPGVSEKQIIRFDKPIHGILRRMEMLKKIQIPSNGTHMDIFIDDKNQRNALSFLQNNHTKPEEFIYLNVGGSLPHKQWPIEKFVALIKIILKNTSLSAVLGGGPEDIGRINSIDQQINQDRIILAKHRTLAENCALIKRAKLLVTPDSGPMHIGFSLKIPTISLWPASGTHPATGIHGEIDPMNGPEYCGPLDIEKSLSCVLRGNFLDLNEKIRGELSPLEPISVDEVWQKILRFL